MENDTGWGQGGCCWISPCGRNRQCRESDAQQWRSSWMGPRARAVTPPVGTKGQPWFTCRLLLLVAAIYESLEPCKQAHMLASEGSQEVDFGCVFWHQKEQKPKSQHSHTDFIFFLRARAMTSICTTLCDHKEQSIKKHTLPLPKKRKDLKINLDWDLKITVLQKTYLKSYADYIYVINLIFMTYIYI